MHWPRLSWNIAVKIKQMKHWSFANGDILTNLANILTHRAANLASIEPCPASSIDLSPAMDGMDVNASIEKKHDIFKVKSGSKRQKSFRHFIAILTSADLQFCGVIVSSSYPSRTICAKVPFHLLRRAHTKPVKQETDRFKDGGFEVWMPLLVSKLIFGEWLQLSVSERSCSPAKCPQRQRIHWIHSKKAVHMSNKRCSSCPVPHFEAQESSKIYETLWNILLHFTMFHAVSSSQIHGSVDPSPSRSLPEAVHQRESTSRIQSLGQFKEKRRSERNPNKKECQKAAPSLTWDPTPAPPPCHHTGSLGCADPTGPKEGFAFGALSAANSPHRTWAISRYHPVSPSFMC